MFRRVHSRALVCFYIMLCPLLLWGTACSTDVGSRFGQSSGTKAGGSADSSDASSGSNANKKLETSDAGSKKKEEVPEDLIAVPPDEISGSYLTCITPKSEGDSPQTLGCVLVDEDGEKRASTAGMKETWSIETQEDEEQLQPEHKVLGEKTNLNAMFSFEEGQITSGIEVTVHLKAKEASKTFSTGEVLKEGSPRLGAFAAGIDMDQEKSWSEEMETKCNFTGGNGDDDRGSDLTLLDGDDDDSERGNRPGFCPPPFRQQDDDG